MQEQNLKPCPFCGEHSLIMVYHPKNQFVPGTEESGLNRCFVRCNKCKSGTGVYEKIHDAVYAWNRRLNNG